MAEHTPTTEEVGEGFSRRPPGHAVLSVRREQEEMFDRWLAAHEAAIRADERAKVLAEWEAEGRRWFTPAYLSLGGNIIEFGYETVVQEHAQRQVDQFTRENPEGPGYFVATRVLPPWERLEPVNESEKP